MTTTRAPSFDRTAVAPLWPFQAQGLAYLNHGTFGGVALPVQSLLAQYTKALGQNPYQALVHDHGGLWFERGFGLVEENRLFLADKVNAAPDGFVLVQGVTEGVSAILTSLQTHGHFKAGDEIVLTSHSYRACKVAAELVCQRTGATLKVADIPFPLTDEAEVLDAITRGLTERTKLALIDHITSKSGLIWPIDKIAAACRAKGVPLLVDGAHALGQVPLDLEALGADFYVGNGHKWLCAPVGVGFLSVAPQWREIINPVVTSYGAADPSNSLPPLVKKFNWQGTRNYAPWFCVKAAYEFLDGLHPDGLAGLMADNRKLVRQGAQLVGDVLGVPALAAPEPMIGQMVSFVLQGRETVLVRKALAADKIITQFVDGLSDGTRILRISAAPYNQLADYERLAKALPAALA